MKDDKRKAIVRIVAIVIVSTMLLGLLASVLLI